jgi:hypothetical protein
MWMCVDVRGRPLRLVEVDLRMTSWESESQV